MKASLTHPRLVTSNTASLAVGLAAVVECDLASRSLLSERWLHHHDDRGGPSVVIHEPATEQTLRRFLVGVKNIVETIKTITSTPGRSSHRLMGCQE